MDSVRVTIKVQECIPLDLQRLTSSGKQLEDARIGGGQWHDRYPQGEDPAQGSASGSARRSQTSKFSFAARVRPARRPLG